MPTNPGASSRAHPQLLLPRAPAALPRVVGVLLALLLLAVVVTGGTAMADRPAPVVALSPAEAERAGIGLALVAQPFGAAQLVEARPSSSSRQRSVLLAVAPDGAAAALADARGQDPTALTILRADGSQVRIAMEGLLAAAFSPDSASLAVVDGLGRLLIVDPAAGSATPRADGPFLGPLSVGADASVLALAVASVEAPRTSRLVRVAADGSMTTLSDERLVYAAAPLADGSLAVVSHRPSGTLVQRLGANGAAVIVDLGPGAVDVSVSPDASAVAFGRGGAAFLLRPGSGSPALELGPGANPRFAPDGSALLLDVGAGTRLIGLDGSLIGEFGPATGFTACPAGCAS